MDPRRRAGDQPLPCSKKISDYGAHNQRSHITIAARVREHLWIEELIDIAESEASCELYGILKRPDEKFVTERAYDNPKFVEDIVRDVAVRLNAEARVRAYVVEAENFESIHNHSAYALIERDKDTKPDRLLAQPDGRCEPGRRARSPGTLRVPAGVQARNRRSVTGAAAERSPRCRREISSLRNTLWKRSWQEIEACSSSVPVTLSIVTASSASITASRRDAFREIRLAETAARLDPADDRAVAHHAQTP